MTTPTPADDHRPEPWFWEADSEHCPHGPEPEDDTTDQWDAWHDRHQWSPQDVRICLDAPMGDHCPECSAEHGDPVPWVACEARDRTGEPYCTGDRCADCTPDEECCEATCGCCPRVDEHDHCRLAPGSEEDLEVLRPARRGLVVRPVARGRAHVPDPPHRLIRPPVGAAPGGPRPTPE